MCGICGIVYSARERLVEEAAIRAMMATMVPRGPDDSGIHLDGSVGLGHRRLKIIDLETGRQPISNEDGTIHLVFNGEIYNYRALGDELAGLGHIFKTRSDTEVIVHAYEQWGEDCPRRLRGMFAFAIHDRRAGKFFAARDRLGIKPFYYFSDSGVLAFASEVKALLASGVVRAEVDADALDSFVSLGYVPGPASLFRGISKLPPGHCLTVDRGRVTVSRYWDFNQVQPLDVSEDEACRLFDEKLAEAVRAHLVSDVPLGVFLSGGLDSSAIVALMRRSVDGPIRTFSVGYRDAPEADELPYARLVAETFHTEHHEFVLEPQDFLESLRLMVRATEEPVVEPAAVALHHIARCAREFVTVALSGEGGDEVLAGYGLYGKFLGFDRWRALAWPASAALRLAALATGGEKPLKYADWWANPPEEAYRGISCDVTPSVRRRMLADALSADDYLDRTFRGHFQAVDGRDLLSRLLYVDAKTWLVDDLLLKADKMTMAVSLELRVPFLDHEVVELAASLPSRLKWRDGQGKYLLRRMMAAELPPQVLGRSKRGFPLPIRRWFRGELAGAARDILLSRECLGRGYFKPGYVEHILAEHAGGRQDFSRRLMSMVVLELWHREFVSIRQK